MTKTRTLLTLALGTALAALLAATPVTAADNPFATVPSEKGLLMASSEGKCGGGKCGATSKTKESKCGEGKCGAKAMEGKCGGKASEGKRDEEKCGGTSKVKPKERKCGEGKCGGMK